MSETDDERQNDTSSDLSTAHDERLQRDLPERIPKLFSTLAIRAENIQHISNGDYNVVFGFKDVSQDDHVERILRVRIDEASERTAREMDDTAAILRFISTRVKTATRITHMDATDANPLLRPYSIQPRLSGVTFADAWDDMSLDDHTAIGKMIVDELIQFGNITFLHPGRLAATPGAQGISLQEIQYYGGTLPLPDNASSVTVEDWLSYLLDWRLKDSSPYSQDCFSKVKKILQSMVSRGYFANLNTIQDCVLDHGDLHANNVIVTQESSKIGDTGEDGEPGKWTLTGFIDWDGARSVPRILSLQPLEWIWCDHLYEDDELAFIWTGHLDFVPAKNWESMPDHMRELKKRIDEYACSLIANYTEDAYGHGRWIRRVAKFAMEGITDNREDTMLDWMVAEWAKVEAEDAINTPLPDIDTETGL